MKLWEVLKALEENPKKVFECNLISGFKALMSTRNGYFDLKIFNCYGELISQGIKGGAFNENISVNNDWHEVKQPVTWQEAVEAWMNGKTIRCTMQGSDFVFDGYKPKLRDQIDTIGRIQLKEGTWYIED